MQLTPEDLRTITEKASSLYERIEGDFAPEPSPDPKQVKRVEARLKEWREISAEGDEELFQKRLAYDGLDMDAARELLGDGSFSGSRDLPSWTIILNGILKQTREFPLKDLDAELCEKYPFLIKESPVPFEEIFLPCILVARKKLAALAGDRLGLLTDKAQTALERFLLQRISEISSRVLEVEFSTFMACLQFSGVDYSEVVKDKNSRKQYLDFVKETVAGGLAPLFKEYCVWARMLAVRIDQWAALVDEFLDRLQTDLPEIKQLFPIEKELGKVADVEPGLSDSHCNGRTVIILTFESGAKLVYKPKSMGLEADYFRFANWLNEEGADPAFKVLKVINRGSYGWVEFVEHLPMQGKEEAVRYFQRSGMFLCLVYLFDGIDFHNENVVASGEYPTPIDMETFFHHRIKYAPSVLSLVPEATEAINNSVVRTHFLPNLYKVKDKFFDITGMGTVPGEEETLEVLKWKNINTDAMNFNYEKIKPNPTKNAARIGDEYLSPEDYTGEIVDGFRRMHQMASDRKEKLLAEDSLFTSLFQNEARFVFRATAFYGSILKKSIHPDYQREGVDLSLQLDILSRSFLPIEDKPPVWPLIREECLSLWEMDIPKLMASGDSDSLTLESGEVVSNSFSQSPYYYVKERIVGPDKKDMEGQVGFIEGAMEARQKLKETHPPTEERSSEPDETPLIDKREMIDHALSLAEEIRSNAYYSKNGEPSWILLKGVPGAEQFMLEAMDFNLYDGSGGVALFLAAMEKVAPGSGFGDLALSSTALTRRWLKKVQPSEISQLGVGGCTGLGSIIYTLVRMGQLLDDSALVEDALQATSLLREKDIDADETYDVLSGSAGAILSLLACHKATGKREVLDKGLYCGEHLLKNRVKGESGFRAWNTIDDTPLLGFSHGAAGIAYALLKLYQATEKPEFLEAASEAVDFETSAFVSKENNWPDFRVDKKNPKNDVGFMCAWCHGAPGIGLARIGGLEILDKEGIRKDIEAALKCTSQIDLQPRDHLCCGNMGRAETLLVAGRALSQPQWVEEAVRLTSQVAARAKQNGSFQPKFRHRFFNASMFQGTAGVGYQLLRLAEPEALPSALLLQ